METYSCYIQQLHNKSGIYIFNLIISFKKWGEKGKQEKKGEKGCKREKKANKWKNYDKICTLPTLGKKYNFERGGGELIFW